MHSFLTLSHPGKMISNVHLITDTPARLAYERKWLQRSLDMKVRKLRSLLTADEDITTELDRVVCRLMKLALKTSRNRDIPPPTTWLQCKLLDLLTLTERAIERRKRHLFNKNPLSVTVPEDIRQNHTLDRIKFSKINDNDTTQDIVDKYTPYIHTTVSDEKANYNTSPDGSLRYTQLDVEDDTSVTSNEFIKIYDCNNRESSSSPTSCDRHKSNKNKLTERNSSSAKHHKLDIYSGVSSSGDTDSIRNHRGRYKKSSKKCNKNSNSKITKNKKSNSKENNNNDKSVTRKRLLTKIIRKKNLCGYVFKKNSSSIECEYYKLRIKRKIKPPQQLNTVPKPISNSLLNLCQQNVNTKKTVTDLIQPISYKREELHFKNKESIAFTEQSCIIEIVTDNTNETIALRRTVATDSNDYYFYQSEQLMPIESEPRLDGISVLTKSVCSINKLVVKAENKESQAIFLYDINEPSTSKGVRHVNMDVQCGPDTGFLCPAPSVTMSLNNIPHNTDDFKNEIDSDINEREQCIEHDMPEDDLTKSENVMVSRGKTNGIQIKDSNNAILEEQENFATMASIEDFNVEGDNYTNSSSQKLPLDDSVLEDKRNSISDLNKDMRLSDQCESDMLEKFSPDTIGDTKLKQEHLSETIDVVNNISIPSHIQRKLTRGGIYIHSYKDRITCEDIMYQGEWQRFTQKNIAKKDPLKVFLIKKNTEQYSNVRRNKNNLICKNLAKTNINNEFHNESQEKNDNVRVRKQLFSRDSEKFEARKSIKHSKNLDKVTCKTAWNSTSPKNIKNELAVKKDANKSQNAKKDKKFITLTKNYVPKDPPSYKNAITIKNKLQQSVMSSQINKNLIKDSYFLTSMKKMNIKKELLKFVRDPRQTISYAVFRNKIEKETDTNKQSSPIKEFRNNTDLKPIRNIQSANSSSSSTNSVATIRQLSPQNKRKFTSSKMALKINNIPKTSSPIRKINTIECTKRTSVIFDDKENDPQSSNLCEIPINKASKQDLERSKSTLVPRNVTSKHKNRSSNNSLKKTYDTFEKKICTSSSSTCKKVSISDTIENAIPTRQLHSDSNLANLVLVLESYKKVAAVESEKLPSYISESEINKKSTLVNKNLEVLDGNGNIDTYNNIRALIEEKLNNGIGEHLNKPSKSVKNKYIIHSDRTKNCEKVHFNENFDNNAATTSLDSGSKQVNVDLISFKSFASISGYSEYFLADNELSANLQSLQTLTPPKKSVHELFERHEQIRLPYAGGTVQGFSGFSINERVIGDQPDYVNLIDSETGSVAHSMDVRRATSEEVFTSGRSSDTYVSCQVDDDTLVPQWLFHAINQQRSEEENEPQRVLLPMPLPIVEPELDINANILEPSVGVGAGAGDGRGIHSDQDSSGRDTSMSSTETSSGQQSEAILVEPSAYATNIEFLREPSSRPFFQLASSGSPDSSFRTVEGSENENAFSVSAGSTRNDLNLGMIQSDRDADVSSLDTDIADFSDN